MAAINAVRFKVKPGRENEFVQAHKDMKQPFPGMRRAWLVKTGDRTYCMVGVWKEMKNMVDARPAMIAMLDKVRDCLEDVGGGLGVTDPVSGETVVEIGGEERVSRRRAKRTGTGAATTASAAAGVSNRRAERRAKKKAERKGERRKAGKAKAKK